jgi:hypothetical protein
MLDPSPPTSNMPAPVGWQAESWRLTAFLGPQGQIREPTWWADLTGQSPESRIANPRQDLFQEHGSYGGGTLTLTTQPGRVDWHLNASPAQSNELPGMRVLGSVLESLDAFRPLALRWLEMAPSIIRLAVGGVLLTPVGDRQEAHRLLTTYVPGLRLDSENCSDFLYQINRPRASIVRTDLLINRLTKWSADEFNLLRFAVQAPSAVLPVSPVQLYIAARLELDLSTAADSTSEFTASELPALFGELVNLGLEIAERGDIP